MKKLIALTTLTLALTAAAQDKRMKIVYGADDRLDLKDVTDQRMLDAARATAVMIPSWKLTAYQDPTTEPMIQQMLSYAGERSLCATERFAAQPAIGDCSGFLVGENKLVTAGHCIDDDLKGCGDKVWVFDYAIDAEGVERPLIEQSNVYSCKKIIKAALKSSTKLDYAVIELDRPVTGRTPMRYRKSGMIKTDTPIVVIGYPSGLPTKVAGGARVMTQAKNYFGGDLDTFGGNSGSAVLNAKTMEVEGILVRGDEDFVYRPDLGCSVSNVRAESQGSEHVTRITKVKGLRWSLF